MELEFGDRDTAVRQKSNNAKSKYLSNSYIYTIRNERDIVVNIFDIITDGILYIVSSMFQEIEIVFYKTSHSGAILDNFDGSESVHITWYLRVYGRNT